MNRWTPNIQVLGNREFPSFLVAGNTSAALVEAGVSSLVPGLLSELKKSAAHPPLRYLVAAHAHADHVCGLIKLKNVLSELLLCGSRQTGRILKKADVIMDFIEDDMGYARYLAETGVPYSPNDRLPARSVGLDMILEDSDILGLGGVGIQAIDAPGHAPGGMAFLVLPDNALLISDAAGYANSARDILPLFFHNFRHTIDSLEKLAAFSPDHLALGHNIRIDGRDAVARFFKHAVAQTERMKNDILKRLGTASPQNEVESALAERMLHYGMFKSFSREKLMGLSRLIIRRALEARESKTQPPGLF